MVNVDDNEMLHKIHLSYRLGFLRDTAAGSWMDEISMAVINGVK